MDIENNTNMIEAINEKVEVILIFSLQPHPETKIYKIRWRGKEYMITKLAYHHKVRDGRSLLHKFSVSSASLDFRLNYDTENLQWMLEEVSDGF
jgi:hypothetical protein